jgi:hypothetical protein
MDDGRRQSPRPGQPLGAQAPQTDHRVRTLLAPWILFVTVFLCVKGYWWGLVFLPFLALDLWLLRSLVRYARTQTG